MQVEPVTLLAGALGWISGVLGAWAAIRTELRWLRRDVDRAHQRLDGLGVEGRYLNGLRERGI